METRYTVINRNGCRLIEGSVPAGDFLGLTKGLSKKAVMDPHAARVLNVTFAMGEPAALRELLDDPEVIEQARRRARRESAGHDLSDEALEWLALGQQGLSSMAMFNRLSGRLHKGPPDHPRDVGDFIRCRRMLEAIPEYRDRAKDMAGVSPMWDVLAAHWDELCASLDEEMPNWREGQGSASKTYTRMMELGC